MLWFFNINGVLKSSTIEEEFISVIPKSFKDQTKDSNQKKENKTFHENIMCWEFYHVNYSIKLSHNQSYWTWLICNFLFILEAYLSLIYCFIYIHRCGQWWDLKRRKSSCSNFLRHKIDIFLKFVLISLLFSSKIQKKW
jgi:hypothetical protein